MLYRYTTWWRALILHIFTKSVSFLFIEFLQLWVLPKDSDFELKKAQRKKHTTKMFYCATESFGYTPERKGTENVSICCSLKCLSSKYFSNNFSRIVKQSVTALKTWKNQEANKINHFSVFGNCFPRSFLVGKILQFKYWMIESTWTAFLVVNNFYWN